MSLKFTWGNRIDPSKVTLDNFGIPKIGKARHIQICEASYYYPNQQSFRITGIDYGNHNNFIPLYSSDGYILAYKKGSNAYTGRMSGSVYSEPIYIIGYLFKHDDKDYLFIFDMRDDVGKGWSALRSEWIERLKDMEEQE